MFRNSSQEPSQDPAGSRVLGALVVPTTIGPPAPALPEKTPHPATRDMAATAATLRRTRFWLNTRTLLDPPSEFRQKRMECCPDQNHPESALLPKCSMPTVSSRCVRPHGTDEAPSRSPL